MYATREPIRTLDQAVARLGLRETRHLLQAVVAENLFTTTFESMERMMRDLWLHSISTAYCNETIAQSLDIAHSEDYFMMGLLHDIGKLVILHLVEIGRKNGEWSDREITRNVVRKLVLKRHNDLGARLLTGWNYPPPFLEVVRRHNDERYVNFHSEPIIVTHFSNLVARRIGYSFVPWEAPPLSDEDIASALNMSAADRDNLEETLVETVERIRGSCFTEFHARSREDRL